MSLALVFCMTGIGRAEQMPVPADVQIPLILKILTFDRNFEVKITTALTIGIVYDPQNPASLQGKDAIAQSLAPFTTKTIKKLPIAYILLEFTPGKSLAEIARTKHINVFYIVPGNVEHLPALLEISWTQQILTVTGVPAYMDKGVAVGISLNRENRPLILINLASSKSAGSAFDANLLKLATIVE